MTIRRTIAKLFKSKPVPLFMVENPLTGKGWIGPHRFNGDGWSEHPKLWYMFSTQNSAKVTLEGCDMFGYKIKQM